jgi:hypothetical protein
MKEYEGSGGISPLILNPSTRWSAEPHVPVFDPLGKTNRYGSSYSIKSPASCIATVGEPRLMSHVGRARNRVRLDQCVLQPERWRCQYSCGSFGGRHIGNQNTSSMPLGHSRDFLPSARSDRGKWVSRSGHLLSRD